MSNKPIRILNLFAGIGGNRTLWNNYKEPIAVTAVEYDTAIASVYQKRFPQDTVIVDDAYDYLIHHFKEFDFIWASPPCVTHTRIINLRRCTNEHIPLPDLRLYSIVLYLQEFFTGNWVVENVIPYYKPLIKPTFTMDRHNFWSNYPVNTEKFKHKQCIGLGGGNNTGYKNGEFRFSKNECKDNTDLCNLHNIDAKIFEGITSKALIEKMLRNMVLFDVGYYIFTSLIGKKQTVLMPFTQTIVTDKSC